MYRTFTREREAAALFELSVDYLFDASDTSLQACECNWLERANSSQKEALRLIREAMAYKARAIAVAWLRQHRRDLISRAVTHTSP